MPPPPPPRVTVEDINGHGGDRSILGLGFRAVNSGRLTALYSLVRYSYPFEAANHLLLNFYLFFIIP